MKILILGFISLLWGWAAMAQSLHHFEVNVSKRLNIYENYRIHAKRFARHAPLLLKKKLLAQASNLDADLLTRLDNIIPSPFINSVAYNVLLSRNDEKLEEALNFFMINRFLLVLQVIDEPRSSPQQIEAAKALLSRWSGLDEWNENSIEFMFNLIQRRSNLISRVGSAAAVVEAIEETPIIIDELESLLQIGNSLFAEPIGTIPGNIISVFMKNDRSLARAQALHELAFVSPTDPARISMAQTIQRDSILRPLFDIIQNARENLIILTPSTSDVSEDMLVTALANKLANSPLLKVAFISLGRPSPRIVNFTHQYPQRFALVAIPDEAQRDGVLSWQAFLPISDQTKSKESGLGLVLVSDSASEIPNAYVTSRRFVDHPHAYSHEQATTMVGPVAGLLAQLVHSNLRQLIPRMTDISDYFPSRESYPAQGQEYVRLTVDSARLGSRDDRSLALKFILEAKEELLLDVHLLYDRAIVDTLIKKKIKNPDMSIMVLLDTNLEQGLNGLPNAIFLAELKRYGIKVRARRSLLWEAVDAEGYPFERHGINHRNLIIRDRGQLFVSSGPFMGSFEKRSPLSIGLIVSSTMTSELAENFIRDWENPNATYELDIENFQAKFGNTQLSKKVSSFLNDVFALLLRAFD